MSSDATMNRAATEWLADAFREVDWPIPPYLKLGGFLVPLAKALKDAAPEAKLEIVRAQLSKAYDANYLSTMYLNRYSKILYARDFRRQIDESIRTYFCGYTFNAVTGLIPVVEGIIRKMATGQNRDVGQGTKRLVDELQAFVDYEARSPHCYGERLVMLEAFRDFVSTRLLENTKRFAGHDEFNRHGILHGLFGDFGREINFLRLVTLLDLLCFCVSLREGGSMFAPEYTPESMRLAEQYECLRAFHQIQRTGEAAVGQRFISAAASPR